MKRLKKFVNYKQVEEFATFLKKDLIFTLEDIIIKNKIKILNMINKNSKNTSSPPPRLSFQETRNISEAP